MWETDWETLHSCLGRANTGEFSTEQHEVRADSFPDLEMGEDHLTRQELLIARTLEIVT